MVYLKRIAIFLGIIIFISSCKNSVDQKPIPKDFFSLEHFVKIPAGSFQMGSINGFPDEKPVHMVTISKPFYMGKYEVTQEQWIEIMGDNPNHNTGITGKNYPVGLVSWNHVQEFIKRLNQKYGRNIFRLPTEAEWEYACRAGTTTPFNTGESLKTNEANYNGEFTTPVGNYPPNAWGLYDMHGNVIEWCFDQYGAYSDSSQIDPIGPILPSPIVQERVARGGSFISSDKFCRSSCRMYFDPRMHSIINGFRLVRVE